MYFMDYLHREGIGVILDWVPAHFPKYDFGLGGFDGTCLYEHPDPAAGHPSRVGYATFSIMASRRFLTSSSPTLFSGRKNIMPTVFG